MGGVVIVVTLLVLIGFIFNRYMNHKEQCYLKNVKSEQEPSQEKNEEKKK